MFLNLSDIWGITNICDRRSACVMSVHVIVDAGYVSFVCFNMKMSLKLTSKSFDQSSWNTLSETYRGVIKIYTRSLLPHFLFIMTKDLIVLIIKLLGGSVFKRWHSFILYMTFNSLQSSEKMWRSSKASLSAKY